MMTSSPELDSDKKFSTAIEARLFGGSRRAGDRRGVERRGAGVPLADLGAVAPERVAPPFRKAAMSCAASSSEDMLATRYHVVRRVYPGSRSFNSSMWSSNAIRVRILLVKPMHDYSVGTIGAATGFPGELYRANDPAAAAVIATPSSASGGCGGARPTRDNAPTLSTASRSSPKVTESSDERERERERELRQQ